MYTKDKPRQTCIHVGENALFCRNILSSGADKSPFRWQQCAGDGRRRSGVASHIYRVGRAAINLRIGPNKSAGLLVKNKRGCAVFQLRFKADTVCRIWSLEKDLNIPFWWSYCLVELMYELCFGSSLFYVITNAKQKIVEKR